MIVCQTCGARFVDGEAAFCSECGTRLVAPSLQKSETTYAGTYVLQTPEVTLTLLLQQDPHGKISGTFSSTRGTQFQVDGQVEEDAAVGLCFDAQGRVYFEARQNGSQLALALIEPDANNMPDYDRVRQLVLTKQEGETASVAPAQPVETSLVPPSSPSATMVEDPG